MLRSLVRWKFVDRTWGPDDLALLAKFWLQLYDEVDHPPHKVWESHQTLELRLTGFTRSTSRVVSDELARRLSESGVPVSASAADPDTLVAITKPREGNRQPLVGAGVAALAGAPFDGMFVEIRFTVADAGATERVRGVFGATLVIVGELRGGAVAVKSVWADPPFVTIEAFWDTPGEWEDYILAAFDRYRGHDEVSRTVADDLFRRLGRAPVNGKKDSLACLWRWLVDVPFGRPRLRALLWRWAAVIAVTAILFIIFLLDPFERGSIWPKMLLGAGAIYYWFVAYEFFKLENARLYALYDQRRAWYDGQFQTPPRFAVVAPDAPRPWLDDPAVRKFTAEVLESGFAHAGDFAAVPIDSAVMVHRMFLAPDEVTYLVLSFSYAAGSGAARSCCWPAVLGIDCYTFNYSNECLLTLDYETSLMNLKRVVPAIRTQALPRGGHPLDLFRTHTKAIEQWERETGIVPLPHERFDVFITRLERFRLQQCEFYRAHPYSRRDHRRWYLQRDVAPSAESQ